MKIDILACGHAQHSNFQPVIDDFQKRLQAKLTIKEIVCKGQNKTADEHKLIEKFLSNSAHIIALDERGKSFSSPEFASYLEKQKLLGKSHFQFIIGGADGLNQDLRSRANTLMAFGQQTWPHLMVRAMLIEQIYRAETILNGHPYHK